MILVDYREPEDIVRELVKLNVPVKREDIEWCDYIVKQGGYEIPVERKTAQDFVASIVDGRIFLQAYMMSTVAPISYIVIEGIITEALMERAFPRTAYIGALSSLALKVSPYGQHGRISIINLDNIYDTALFLKNLHKQLEEKKLHRLPRLSGLEKRTLDKKGVLILMLQAIPGVGPEKAQLLVEKFGSLKAIMEASVASLASVPGIGPRLAQRIKEYLVWEAGGSV